MKRNIPFPSIVPTPSPPSSPKTLADRSGSRFLLLTTPFLDVRIPSIQLAVLEGLFRQTIHSVDIHHLYVLFASFLEPDDLEYISQLNEPEVLYQSFLFGVHISSSPAGNDCRHVFSSWERIKSAIARFHCYVLDSIDWSSYRAVGFSISYNQLLPSLFFAREIKQRFPGQTIIFGGTRMQGDLGVSILRTFPWVDYGFSGYAENSLPQFLDMLDSGIIQPKAIAGLIYRLGESIQSNKEADVRVEQIPAPIYDNYFRDLSVAGLRFDPEQMPAFKLYIENSRSCQWKRCTFCSLPNRIYTEKKPEDVVAEIETLHDRYGVKQFRLVGESYKFGTIRRFCRQLIALGVDVKITAYSRVGLHDEDYQLLKQAGVDTLMMGIESFSRSLLAKMNKGTLAIRNIEALKFCEERGIVCLYNLFLDFPNFATVDLQETLAAIRLLAHLRPPLSAHHYFELQFGSEIFMNPSHYAIRSVVWRETDQRLFPAEYQQTLLPFQYDYIPEPSVAMPATSTTEISRAIESWKERYHHIGSPLLYQRDVENSLTITDTRTTLMQQYTFTGPEREILLFCYSVRHIDEIKNLFSVLNHQEIEIKLHQLIGLGFLWREDDLYISLPLAFSM